MKLISKVYKIKRNWSGYGDDYTTSETYEKFVERVTEEVQEFISESGLSLVNLNFMERTAVAVFKE